MNGEEKGFKRAGCDCGNAFYIASDCYCGRHTDSVAIDRGDWDSELPVFGGDSGFVMVSMEVN